MMHSLAMRSGCRFIAGVMLLLALSLNSVASAASPLQQNTFLNELAKDTWIYLTSDWATDNHLPWSWRSDTLTGGDYVNTTEIGLYLLAYLGAYEMGQPWRPDLATVQAEVTAGLDQLRAWQTGSQPQTPGAGANAYNNSVFYQWYWINPTPRVGGVARDDNHVVPSIDNAFLAAALLTIRAWAETGDYTSIAQRADAILQDMNFRLWYDSGSNRFTWGTIDNPSGGGDANYFSNENRIINYVARALGQLTTAEYQASLSALIQSPATFRGITVDKVAYDGSYFTYTAPALFIREMETAYGSGTIEPATRAQIAYAATQGYGAWGLSDNFDIGTGDYIQQGAPPVGMVGSPETHPGVVTPHASALALITPLANQAQANLQKLASIFSCAYDPTYGFRESVATSPVDVLYKQCSARFSALAQEWLFLSIVNQQTAFIWRYFYRDSGVVQAHNEMFQTPDAPSQINVVPPLHVYRISRPELTWNRLSWATGYDIEVSSSPYFASPYDYNVSVPASQLSVIVSLPLIDGLYYWRVRGQNPITPGIWGISQTFLVDTI